MGKKNESNKQRKESDGTSKKIAGIMKKKGKSLPDDMQDVKGVKVREIEGASQWVGLTGW